MSIFRLESAPFSTIDCRYIESVDIEVTNSGSDGFEMLVHGYGNQGLFYVQLIHLSPGSTVPVYHMMTGYDPFQLVLVTNINNYACTEVIVRAKDHDYLIALYSQEDMIRTL
ncbi:hypothetical protein G8C92_18545 [Paenibacillus donghaensis]|uniref:hypothetical protein n=1 Tax=Paenibacillus donghaensis TaxID=414771 RepID=UPI0018839F35|nr:hypothetical protein [Paenibacillus donghaensis]MBE9916017.1 hypothetical protein [Paenibacillus donghaensis]